MPTIRKAASKDAPKIKELYLQLMLKFEKIEPYFYAQDRNYWKTKANFRIREFMRKKDILFLVLEENKDMVGFVHLVIEKREQIFKLKNMGYIDALYVKPGFRKKGYGKLLLKESLKWFKKKGVVFYTIITSAKDKSANQYWKKRGFREWEIRYNTKKIIL